MALEAAPLVEHYRLQPAQKLAPFPVFESDDLRLIVSGIGRINAALAVAWLSAIDQAESDMPPLSQEWLNIGIGGSGAFCSDTLVIAERVDEASSGRRWKIPISVRSLTAARIITVDRPQTEYSEPVVYEMEASGFLAAARRVCPRAKAHCAKIISDGPDAPIAALSPDIVSAFVDRALPSIERLVAELQGTDSPLCAMERNPGPGEFLARWHFSVEQSCQLHRLLRRALRGGIVFEMEVLTTITDAGTALRALEQQLISAGEV